MVRFVRAQRAIILFLLLTFMHSVLAGASERTVSGGKWMPHQMDAHAEKLKELGLEIDTKELSNLDLGLLRAIVSLGFCSGSFISPNGLIITNHHCAQALLSFMSQIDRERGIQSDYVTNGFHAKTLAEERSAGPAQKIYVTQKIVEVSEAILRDIDFIQDPHEKRMTIERRMAEMVKAAELNRPGIRVEVKEFYRSSQFFLIEQREIQDIRVVYAPPKMVGFFGGDADNWHYPRHTGDWAILRAYVAPDGSSAPYDEKNVPFQPAQFLKIAPNGLSPNDLVMVAGYPGITNRLLTTAEVTRQMNESMPDTITYFRMIIETYDNLSKQGEDLRIKVESSNFGAANVLKKNVEQHEALTREGFLKKKLDQERDFQSWIAAEPNRMLKYGWASKVLESIYEKYKNELKDALANRLFARSPLLASALTIVRMADERAKPDEEREPAYKQRNWPRIIQSEIAKQGTIDKRIDTAIFNAVMAYTDKTVPLNERPKYVEQLFAQWHADPKFAEQLYANTALDNQETRVKLLETATLEELEQSSDKAIQLALRILPIIKAQDRLARSYAGEASKPMRRLMEALQMYHQIKGDPLAPDANSTLRLTYGIAKGYFSPTRQRYMPPFTNARGILDKNRPGSAEFEVPHQLVRALNIAYFDPERKIDTGSGFGPLGDPMFGDLPVNFLATVDTTGGNSGSAAMNKRGELIGLLFDGNEDSLAVDFRFDDKGDRSILLHIAYALWYMSKVDKAYNLLEEMTIPAANCRDYLLEGSAKPSK
ncbi:MAG TPA: S46 family peptidase [Oligoflexia bacterium]|nr:S46 family peptidase [Oligoflexia bacterium]